MRVKQALLLGSLTITAASVGISSCPGYTASNVVTTGSSLTASLQLAGTACNVYGQDIENLTLLVEYQTNSRLHVKIYDTAEQVYQIPEQLLTAPTGGSSSANSSDLEFTYTESPFSFAVQRASNGDTLFNTSAASLVFESQYVRLRTSLPEDPYLYGLGEDSDNFRLNTTNYMRTMWNRGAAFLPLGQNLYGSHPVYYEMRNGTAHGVFLFNSDGMDININNTAADGQYLEYNTNGGVLDFYFMSGPGPADVSRQYAQIMGTPAEQAYWTYGFHQCKYGYQDVMMVAEVVYNYSQAGIPLETMWTDIDYMDLRRTWTTDPQRFPLHMMQELVTYLHDHQQHYIMMVDPPVSMNDSTSYNNGLKADAYIKDENGTIFVGTMWPGAVSYVDWLAPGAQPFWTGQVESFFNADTGIDVDAIWIDMNEPANFCQYPCSDPVASAVAGDDPPAPPPLRTTWPPLPGFPADFQPPNSTTKSSKNHKRQATGSSTGLPDRDLLNPPYAIHNGDGALYENTIWPNLPLNGGYTIYDFHNLYASGMQDATRNAMLSRRPGQRPLIISRSTFAGTGNKTGHWTGDNASLWEHYRISIWQNMEFAALFQIPMVGADVCGFNDNTTETLCARWAVLGAWYPFYRNHADITANFQEFYRWPLVTAAAKSAIKTRFQLLDYFYTAFHQQSVDGTPGTIIPLFFQYPNDPTTLDIQLQFFYGPSLLVSPVTDENSTSVTFYLPKDTFYDFFTGEQVQGQGEWVTRDNVNYTEIPVHIRGGSIVPMRVDGANTTTQLRDLDFELLIAPDANGNANGTLYLDDGISIQPTQSSDIRFVYSAGTLKMDGTFQYPTKVKIQSVTLLGSSGKASNGGSKGSGSRQGKKVTVEKSLSKGFSVNI